MLGVCAPAEALTWSESEIQQYYESGGCDMPEAEPAATEVHAPSPRPSPRAAANKPTADEERKKASQSCDRKHLANALQRVAKYSTKPKPEHCDLYGHVNNASYLTLFEDARWAWLTANGYGFDTVKETGQGPVLLEANIKYLKEVNFNQIREKETQVLQRPY